MRSGNSQTRFVANASAGIAMKLIAEAPVANMLMPAAHQRTFRLPRENSALDSCLREQYQPIQEMKVK